MKKNDIVFLEWDAFGAEWAIKCKNDRECEAMPTLNEIFNGLHEWLVSMIKSKFDKNEMVDLPIVLG